MLAQSRRWVRWGGGRSIRDMERRYVVFENDNVLSTCGLGLVWIYGVVFHSVYGVASLGLWRSLLTRSRLTLEHNEILNSRFALQHTQKKVSLTRITLTFYDYRLYYSIISLRNLDHQTNT